MLAITPCPLPEDSLLRRYDSDGNYTDCFRTRIKTRVSKEQYIRAFYTTPLFKLERLILKWLAAKPSTDAQAHDIAAGQLSHFAAWQVEDSNEIQLLMRDFTGRTRSWFMLEAGVDGEQDSTLLYFGSAVTAAANQHNDQRSLGRVFGCLLGFHKIYSRLLLYSARLRLENL